MSTESNAPAWEAADQAEHADDPRAIAFESAFPERPIPAAGPFGTGPASENPPVGHDLDALWAAIEPETRIRSNDLHLPMAVAYADRLCAAYPQADAELVRVTTLLHDTGWAHVDEDRIISEGFAGDWRKAAIRYEHEIQGCLVARRVLPGLGYSEDFVDRVCEIIDGHDTRQVAYSLEDALVRDADRLWRFDAVGIGMASSWFGMTPSEYTDRLAVEILPELITEAAVAFASADLARSEALLKTAVLR